MAIRAPDGANKIQNMQYAKSKLGFGVRLYTGSKPQRTAGKIVIFFWKMEYLVVLNRLQF